MNEALRRDFLNPPPEFRPLQIIHGFEGLGAAAERIGAGLEALAAAGVGGVVANVGWPGYLRDEGRWRTFLLGAEETRRRDLALWIYDEEGYPSGAAGDIVLDGHPQLEARGLICAAATAQPGQRVRVELPAGAEGWVCAVGVVEKEGAVAERVLLKAAGVQPLEWQAPDNAGRWTLRCFASQVMFEDTHATTNVFARRRYVNVLDPRVGRRFVEVTHEQYARRLAPETLGHVAAAFTDEPSLIVAYHNAARGPRPAALPWSAQLPEQFARRAGYALEPHLPELFFDVGDFEPVRCDFYRVVADLIAEGFLGPIQEWSRAHGIASSGHLLCEERLSWHVWFEGDLFRCLRRMDWPGLDLLSSIPQDLLAGEGFLTPKFVSSAAHLLASPVVMSETSDHVQQVQGTSASIAQMAGTAGLQFALGVNLITSYYRWHGRAADEAAAWLGGAQPAPSAAAGAAPGDAYRAWCDYVGRLAVMLRGGRHVCPVAVCYPVSAMQALLRPTDRPYYEPEAHGPQAAGLDALVRDLGRGLLQRQVDFDFVDDQALAEAAVWERSLCVAGERYAVLLLPGARVMELGALEAAVNFARGGGTVIAVGDPPQRAARSGDARAFARLAGGLGRAGVEPLGLEEGLERAAAHAPRALRLEPRSPHLLVVHRERDDGLQVRFITSTSPHPCAVTVSLPEAARGWRCWPRTGQVETLDSAEWRLELAAYEGVFIVTG